MEKYDIKNWEYIIAYVFLPIGECIDVPAYVGKDVPERFTVRGHLKRWQRSISRDKKRRKALHITATSKKCPKCGGRMYRSIDYKGDIHHWCGRFPECDYMKLTHSKPLPSYYYDLCCPNCGDTMNDIVDKKSGKMVVVCDSCSFRSKPRRIKINN